MVLFLERDIISRMSTITTMDVQRLAQLSNLQLTLAEENNLQKNLEDIVRYITSLSELDTSGVEPTYQVTGLENVWRDDQVIADAVDGDTLLTLAPETENNQVKVPKVL